MGYDFYLPDFYPFSTFFMTNFWSWVKMTIWKSVQKTASEIDFKVDESEIPAGGADGTGVGIKGIAERGKELKVFV